LSDGDQSLLDRGDALHCGVVARDALVLSGADNNDVLQVTATARDSAAASSTNIRGPRALTHHQHGVGVRHGGEVIRCDLG
jgi:hypothetical protein